MASAGVEVRRRDAATHAVAACEKSERREACSDVLEQSVFEKVGIEVKASAYWVPSATDIATSAENRRIIVMSRRREI